MISEEELEAARRRVLEEYRAQQERRRELERERQRVPGPVRKLIERVFGR